MTVWTQFCVPVPAEIYCCGLLSSRKSDCTGLPLSMLTNPATPPARGQHRIKMKGNMSLICWYNKGHFRFLTNAYSPLQQGGGRQGLWAALESGSPQSSATSVLRWGRGRAAGATGARGLPSPGLSAWEGSHDGGRICVSPDWCVATVSGRVRVACPPSPGHSDSLKSLP